MIFHFELKGWQIFKRETIYASREKGRRGMRRGGKRDEKRGIITGGKYG